MKAWRGRFIKAVFAQLTDEEAADWAISAVAWRDGLLIKISSPVAGVDELLSGAEIADDEARVFRATAKRMVADMRELIKEPTC